MQDIDLLMFTDLYDTKKTLEELKKIHTYEVMGAKGFIPSVINKRTIILPSTQYFNEKIRVLQFASTFYDMYVEKEEIAPKDEDE